MKFRSMWLVMLIAVPMVLPPSRVVAQTVEDPVSERFDSRKFWDYAGCGASIVFAAATGGWILAALVCGKAITEHWTE